MAKAYVYIWLPGLPDGGWPPGLRKFLQNRGPQSGGFWQNFMAKDMEKGTVKVSLLAVSASLR